MPDDNSLRMPDEDPFLRAHGTGQCLTRVRGYFFVSDPADGECFDDMLFALQFHFGSEVVVIEALGDYDTVGVFGAEWNCTEKDVVSRDLNEISPWDAVLGRSLVWSWRMENQQGYFDGIQLQFNQDVQGAGLNIQLFIQASEIFIYDFHS